MWRALARYFPAELVKTAELDPQHSYVFALHPHGILTCNSWMNFSSEATGFSKLFPGIEMHTGAAQQPRLSHGSIFMNHWPHHAKSSAGFVRSHLRHTDGCLGLLFQ